MRARLPIRVKLATVSAALTFVILLLFALVVGAFTEQKLKASYDDDLRATAADLQERIRVRSGPDGQPRLAVPSDIVRAAAAGGSVIHVLDRDGKVIAATARRAELGPPVEGIRDVSGYRSVSRPLFATTLGRPGQLDALPPPVAGPVAFVQYAKPKTSLDTTLARVRLFLALGVLGGTTLAFFAGFFVARRAMRPIAGLTRAAREVARTRDPAVSLPKAQANDEVADLAHTLEDMLGELDAARSETEHALASQREFVADASHELRTPLTSILANLEILESELRGEQEEIAQSALRSSRRMRRLVTDLLLLARADAGRRVPRRTVDFTAVARDAVGEAAPLASPNQVSLDAPEQIVLSGGSDDLHRMVLNLVENAIIHTPAGTPVTVSIRREGPDAVLEVADRGPGVPRQMRERVFERFARGGRDAAAAGSGLGLAIVRAVAESHGGSVELSDASGGGALFRVRLPAEEGEPATPRPLRGAPSAGA